MPCTRIGSHNSFKRFVLSILFDDHGCNRRWFWLVDFRTSSSATRLSRGRVPRLTPGSFYMLPQSTERETMTFVSSGHITLTPTQQIGADNRNRYRTLSFSVSLSQSPSVSTLSVSLPPPPLCLCLSLSTILCLSFYISVYLLPRFLFWLAWSLIIVCLFSSIFLLFSIFFYNDIKRVRFS